MPRQTTGWTAIRCRGAGPCDACAGLRSGLQHPPAAAGHHPSEPGEDCCALSAMALRVLWMVGLAARAGRPAACVYLRLRGVD